MQKINSIIFVLSFIILTQSDLIYERISIIDKVNNNYLLRGNLPIKNTEFQYKQLTQTINQITNTSNSRTIIISLLNLLTPKQTKNKYIEEKFIQKFQHKNKLIYLNYVVLGSLINPQDSPKFLKDFFIKNDYWFSFDKLNSLLEIINNYLNSQEPTNIYVHCSAGVDRTGYVGGAYKMRYFKHSLQQVIQQNLGVLKGLRKNMHFNTYNGLQWYCLSLGRTQKQCLIGENRNYKQENLQE